ncbi:MAG: hypothetical protein CSB23_05360 [Deltaproteobacteria bacterium]|nr:MAG: hypothetical protein CSB23_05360 [Deltaproteobacteria bacterium]
MEVTGDPDGANDGTTTVSLTAGEDNLDQDFGYHLVGGQLGDTVWFDSNGNGIQDPDEPGLANVRVILTGNLDADPELEHLITLTDANGNYQFDDLPAGHYTVEIDPSTLPNGVEATHDLDGTSTVNVAELDLGINGVNQDVDFGYTGTGSIGDTIWYDADNDGIQDPGESGIPGVTLTLIGDVNGDGTPETYTTQTDGNGNYIFDNLPEGNFVINVDTSTLPGGMVITADPDGVTDSTTTVNLAAGEVNTDQDFAYTGTGSIGDTIWNDLDGDGVQDPGEPGLSGVQITIGVDLDGDGVPDHTTTTTTNASGGYIFDNLPEGSHVVSVNPSTLPEDMAPTADLDGDGTADNSIVVTLSSGTMDTDVIDFGYIHVEHPDGGPHDGPHGVSFPPMLPPEPVTEGPVVDAFFLYQQFGEGMTELPWERLQDIEYSLPPLSVGTVYTGIAEPGTTLFLTLYDNDGNQVGYQTVMADAAGNWLASFPATLMYDVPHHMNIEQTASNYNEDGTLGLFNLRTYFNPNFTSMVYSNSTLDVDAVLAFLPSTIMASMHESNLKGFELGWNDFEGYEFSAPSVNPAKNIH